jgi:glycosyltransferase involved in cell wall biosynthesis
VLSWSFIEAMAAGSLIVASATPPVRELLKDGRNGLAVDFFDRDAFVARIVEALGQPLQMEKLRLAARATAVKNYDLKRVLLPRWLEPFEDLVTGRRPD